MSKKVNIESIIESEIQKVEAKVHEFQQYMTDNNISGVVSSGGEFSLSEENQDKLHKEIAMQIKMMDSVLNWLPLLKKLREVEVEKEKENRGNVKVGGLFKSDQ